LNKVRLKELMDAWNFPFVHICHPYRGEEQIETLDTWAENQASLFLGSRRISRDVDHSRIRLKTGKQIHFYLSDEEGNSLELRSLIVDLWRLIRDCQLAEMDTPCPQALTQRHYAQNYDELQLQVELLSIGLGENLPSEVHKWLKFKHWENGLPVKKRKKITEDDIERILSSPSLYERTVSSTRQFPENSLFGAPSAEVSILSRTVSTIAQSIAQRHIAYHLRLQRSRAVLEAEEDQDSPLTSDGEDSSPFTGLDDDFPLPAEDAPSPWIQRVQTGSAPDRFPPEAATVPKNSYSTWVAGFPYQVESEPSQVSILAP
jgi:hypothetical protein